MSHRLISSISIVSCMIASPAYSQITPVRSSVNASGISQSSSSPAGQSLSATGNFASTPGSPVATSSYGSYLSLSTYDTGIYSYTESDLLAASAGAASPSITNAGGFSYQFRTDSAAILDIDYSFSGNSYFTGNVVTISDISGLFSQTLAFADNSQLSSILLEPNKEYILSTSLNASPFGPASLSGSASGATQADFTYTVFFNFSSATPEPASWAMMIIGLGLIGGWMRRQQIDRPLPERLRNRCQAR